uniref:Nucleoplasmin-like domain-containing protein n=1 Tax=Timspurckia oligopyrenoides TaxID=708627 RepID=A0A7S0ZAD9_9RHOD
MGGIDDENNVNEEQTECLVVEWSPKSGSKALNVDTIHEISPWKLISDGVSPDKLNDAGCNLNKNSSQIQINVHGQYKVLIRADFDSKNHLSNKSRADKFKLALCVEESERMEFHFVDLTKGSQGFLLHLASGSTLKLQTQLGCSIPDCTLIFEVGLVMKKHKPSLTWDEELNIGSKKKKKRKSTKEPSSKISKPNKKSKLVETSKPGKEKSRESDQNDSSSESNSSSSWDTGFSSDTEEKERDPKSARNVRRLAKEIESRTEISRKILNILSE